MIVLVYQVHIAARHGIDLFRHGLGKGRKGRPILHGQNPPNNGGPSLFRLNHGGSSFCDRRWRKRSLDGARHKRVSAHRGARHAHGHRNVNVRVTIRLKHIVAVTVSNVPRNPLVLHAKHTIRHNARKEFFPRGQRNGAENVVPETLKGHIGLELKEFANRRL